MTLVRRLSAAAAGAAVLLVLGSGTALAAPGDLNDQDRTFLMAAHQSNLAEIASARIAQQKATKQVTRELAARWIADHTRLDAALRPVAQRLNVELPDAPSPAQQQVAARYRATSGPAFDRLWVTTQRAGHAAALAVGEAELAGGSQPEVIALARSAAPVIAAHHELLEAAYDEVGIAPVSVDAGSGGQAGLAERPRALALGLLGGGMLLVLASMLVWRRTSPVRGHVRR